MGNERGRRGEREEGREKKRYWLYSSFVVYIYHKKKRKRLEKRNE